MSRRLQQRNKPLPIEEETMQKLLDSGMTEEEIQNLKISFDTIDKDFSGQISAREIYKAMKGIGNAQPIEEIEKSLDALDKDQNGEVNFEEYCMLVQDMNKRESLRMAEEEDDRVIKAFMHFDKEKEDRITSSLFKRILEKMGYHFTPKFTEEVFKKGGVEKNGYVYYRKFVPAWRKFIKEGVDKDEAIKYGQTLV